MMEWVVDDDAFIGIEHAANMAAQVRDWLAAGPSTLALVIHAYRSHPWAADFHERGVMVRFDVVDDVVRVSDDVGTVVARLTVPASGRHGEGVFV